VPDRTAAAVTATPVFTCLSVAVGLGSTHPTIPPSVPTLTTAADGA